MIMLTPEEMDAAVFAFAVTTEAIEKGVGASEYIRVIAGAEGDDVHALLEKLSLGAKVLEENLCFISPEATTTKPTAMPNRLVVDAGWEYGNQAWRVVTFTPISLLEDAQ
jgi:hypothetical protein